jgi:predicted negative regulator of RcsB-dependent stress response
VEDLTDNEREEQLRRWWSDNWAWIIGGVALGLALLAGWQYWQRYQAQKGESDESTYLAVVRSLDAGKRDDAARQSTELRQRRPGSPYADQADLALARAAVEARQYDEAAGLLKRVADGSRDAELRLVAQTRLARVLLEQGKPDEALALLDVAKAGAFAGQVHDIRGDALAAKGDVVGARKEYESALAAAKGEAAVDQAFIELKRDSLLQAAAAPAPVAPAAAPAEAPTVAPAEVPAK